MGISNPRLSVPRDPPVWCEAETGSAANITPELPAEREKALSKHGRRRAVINPRPRMVGRSGRLGAATRVVPQRFIFRLCLLGETKAIFLLAKTSSRQGRWGGLPQPVCAPASQRQVTRRAVERGVGDAAPYGRAQDVRWSGRPRGSPLRRVTSSTGGGPMWGAN